jgi:flagellar protein FliS
MYQALRTPNTGGAWATGAGGASGAAGAGEHYRSIELTSKIEAASPHRLISILYDELILSLSVVKGAIRRGDAMRINEARARAQSIVQTLDAGLDHAKGGDIAGALASVYREVDRLIASGCRTMDAGGIHMAQNLISEIAEAWNQIG